MADGRLFPVIESGDEVLARKIYHEMVWPVIQPYTISRKYDFKDWANDIRLMRTKDGHSLEEIEEVFRWANKNEVKDDPKWDGWRTHLLSPKALREKWDKVLGGMIRSDTRKRTSPLPIITGKVK